MTDTVAHPTAQQHGNQITNLTLKVWRQKGPDDRGHFETYKVDAITDEASFLEMLDVLNERLIAENREPIVFDHDCREGICGTCSLMIDGQAERYARAEAMVETMETYFGSCTNHGECEAACPKSISIDVIALMNTDYLKSKFKNRKRIDRG